MNLVRIMRDEQYYRAALRILDDLASELAVSSGAGALTQAEWAEALWHAATNLQLMSCGIPEGIKSEYENSVRALAEFVASDKQRGDVFQTALQLRYALAHRLACLEDPDWADVFYWEKH